MRFIRDVLCKTPLRPLLLLLAACALPALAQSFSQPKVIPTGNWPMAVYSADVNHDGYPDLIYTDPGPANGPYSTTHILLNDGHGNFTQSATVLTNGVSLALADVNGDGNIDIVWAAPVAQPSPAFSAFVAYGRGDGTFAGGVEYGTPIVLGPSSPPLSTFRLNYVVAGHFYSKTGPLDVAFQETTQHTLGKIVGSIAGSTLVGIPAGNGPAAVADLNGDGYQDLIIQQSNTNVLVELGGANFYGTSAPLVAFSGTSGIHSFLIKDVNLDGVLDLIAEGANGHIDVFFGNGDGTFQTTSSGGTGSLDGTTGNGGHLIATGDFNHDNLLDALTATPIGVAVLLGQGTQYLGLKGIYNAGPGRTSYALADFNNDGNPDLAVDSPEGIAILFGKSDGSFQTNQAFSAGQPAMSGALGHLVNPSSIVAHLDAVVSTGSAQAQVLVSDGMGAFTAVGGSSPTPTTPQNGTPGLWGVVHIGNFFDSFTDDIAITADGGSSVANGGVLIPLANGTPQSGLIYQRGNGDGTFQPPIAITGPASSQQVANSPAPFYGVSAVDPYNDPSILFTRDASSYRYTGDSTNTYPLVASSIFGTQTTSTNHAHDLIAATPITLSVLPILVAQQDGDLFVFSPDLTFRVPLLGDLAVDGSLTIPGQLTAPDISPTFPGMSNALGFRAFPGSAVIADLDGDGNGDLVVAYDNLDADHTAPTAAAPNKIYIWYGSGSGQFLTSAKHPVNPVVLTPSRNFYQVAVADMNGDGTPDLILSDGYLLSVQLGKGDGTFGAETHYLAGQGINTISVGDLRNLGRNDLVIANGGAVLSNPVANKEVLAANPDVNTGGVTVLLNQVMSLLGPVVNITVSPEPSTYGSAFTITATVTGTGSNPPPTGSVTFYIDGTQASSGITLSSSGVASFQLPAPNTLAIGPHIITSYYSGDNHYDDAQPAITHNIISGTSVTASPEPSVYGNIFVVTATAPGPGTFEFEVDGASIGTVITTSANTAAVDAPGIYGVGMHSLTVFWFAPLSAIAVQITGTHQVVANPTTISLVLCVDNPGSLFPCSTPLANSPLISPITFFYGQSLDGAASESATNLTGSILFYDGTTVFCTLNANLGGGANTCPPQSGFFNAGTRTVHATYTGDPNNLPSTSNSIQVIVYADPTTANLTSSLNPAVVGSTITFTMLVTGNYATPTGTVNLYDGTTLIGASALVSSGANTATVTFTNSTLAVGAHVINAVYNSNPNFSGFTSTITQVITAVVVPPPPGTGFTFNVTPTPVIVGAGATGILLATVAPQSNSTPPAVALSCSGLPDETTCTFVTSTLPAGGGATTLQLHVSAPHDCGATNPYFIGSNDGPASPVPYTFAAVFFGALAIFKRRRKTRGIVILAILVSLFSLASLSGCGHCTDLGTRPGVYSFTVIATPQGASTTPTQSLTIPLTVTIP